jgi:hypothetical protein
VRRDLRRFLCVGWTLLDAPAHAALSLGSEWKRRRGYVPPDRPDVTRGYHFRIPRGRGVYVVADQRGLYEAAVARACALVGLKYRVEARHANESELPQLPSEQHPQTPGDERIEEWPSADHLLRDRILLEYIEGGLFVSSSRAEAYGVWLPPTDDPLQALVFDSLDDADTWRLANAPMERVQPRYRAAAIAECDLREASAVKSW